MINVLDFGADPTGQTDSLPAFQTAIHSIPYEFRLAEPVRAEHIYVPRGRYRLDGSLIIDRAVWIQGDGGRHRRSATVIELSQGSSIEFKSDFDSSGSGSASTPNGAGSRISDLALFGSGVNGTPHNASEIICYKSPVLENLHVGGFTGTNASGPVAGIELVGSGGIGNVNGWRLTNVVFEECNIGLYVYGGDCNGGSAITCEAYGCGTAFHDESFLGNLLLGCLAEGNITSYYVDGATNRTLLVGCYKESGQEIAIGHPALVLGGNLVTNSQKIPAPSNRSSPLAILDWANTRGPITVQTENGTRKVQTQLGQTDGVTVLTFLDQSDTQGMWLFSEPDVDSGGYSPFESRWILARNGEEGKAVMAITRERAKPSPQDIGPDQIQFPRGLHLGLASPVHLGMALSQPTDLEGRIGDLILAKNPTSTLDGWRKTVSGWRPIAFAEGH